MQEADREELESLRLEIAELKARMSTKIPPRIPDEEEKLEIDTFFREKIAPLNSIVLLPDGKYYTREELMVKLGIDPSIPPEAWICGAGCGSNSVAGRRPDLGDIRSGVLKRGIARTIR